MSVSFLLSCGAAGMLLFILYVLAVFRTGAVFTERRKNGLLKKKPSFRGILNSALLLALITAFLFFSNLVGVRKGLVRPGFGPVFFFDFLLYCVLFAYDTLVIDYLVLSKWRPRFLKLPRAMNSSSMAKHMVYSLPAGLFSGAVLSLASAFLTWAFVR
jgi:hypothetical protein